MAKDMQGSLTVRMSDAMVHNVSLFLRKAAVEIVGHDDTSDAAFDGDRATVVTVLTQTAVELASTAVVLRNEGLAGVMLGKHLPATEAEAEKRWRDDMIRTISFEDLKPKAARYIGDEGFWAVVDFLQHKRNKLVHFHTSLEEEDRFDLKYDAIDVLIQVIAALRDTDEFDLAYGSMDVFGEELFQKLLSFEPYRERIAARARQIDTLPLTCPICAIAGYLPSAEACIGCGWAGELNLLPCPKCRQTAVIYDHLNLPINVWLKAVCGNCDWEGQAHRCDECDLDFVTGEHENPACPWSADHEHQGLGRDDGSWLEPE